jgi:hypothetical protein
MNKYDRARKEQISRLVVATISKMGNYSTRALNAVMMVAAHESLRGTMREQVISFDMVEDVRYKLSKDYAKGICGMETFTHDDLWENSDNIKADYRKVFGSYASVHVTDADRQIYDDKYAIFLCRKKLHMIMDELPRDLMELAHYLVKYYNAGGKATAEKYHDALVNWGE